MKFGIITLVSDNYGNKYQNYAVEQVISQYGDVETYGLENLYHIPEKAQRSKLSKLRPSYIREVLISRPMYQYDINCVDKGVFYNLCYVRKHRTELIALQNKRRERFQTFANANLNISEKVLNRENTTKVWVESIDCFVCGSDQIWNPSYATTSELAFCSFAPEKTVCFSPSFGVAEIPADRKTEYAKWISQIKSLSVREQAGQKIIKTLTGRNAEVLLDPTMALPVEKWEELSRKPDIELPEHYIVCYFLGRIDGGYRKKICDFAKEKKLEVVMLFDITTPKYYTLDPAEVLYAIKCADYVLTDSFHGSVFSVLFHRNFCVFGRNEGGASMNSRIETLLRKFELEFCVYGIEGPQDIPEEKWDRVDAILDAERVKTNCYLNDKISNVMGRCIL